MKRIFLAGVFAVALLTLWLLLSRPAEREAETAPAESLARRKLPASPAPAPSEPVAPPAPAVTQARSETLPAAPVEDTQPPDLEKITAFGEWTERWIAATPAAREALKNEGRILAAARRPEFKRLIKSDPRRALELSVARVVRQDLPEEIVAQLETPVSAQGNLNVYLGKPAPGVVPPAGTELTLRYFETKSGASYKARVFGKLEPLMGREDIPLRGVAIDREFAVAESPVRQLENGERIPQDAIVEQTCPVSKITTPGGVDEPVTDAEPAVELGGRFIRLCDGSHVHVLDEEYTTAIMASGPGGAGYFQDAYPGTSSKAIGNFRCLYIRVTYPDQIKAPNTETSAYSDMRNVARFYLESSFGRMTTTSAVTPLIVMPHSQAWYIAKDSEVDGLGLVHSDARAEARSLGYDSGQFTCTIVRVNGGPRLSGVSWGGGNSVWVSWDGMDVLNHECGHSLGRNHANFWTTSDGSAIGVGTNSEYGNTFDVMGGGSGFAAHYNTISKRALGWIDDAYLHRPGSSPASSGIYRIYAYDQPRLEEGKRYSLRVQKDAQRTFHLEYHPAYNTQLANSVLMLIEGLGSNCGHLIDTTPGSAGGKNDGGIQIGRTFSDFESDIHFTVLGKNATTPPSMDVAYMRGPFPGNRPPAVSLAATATAIATGGSITFTANATDPDGDALAYHWDFSDGYVATNSAVVTRAFSAADQQTVCLTVSDTKGGTARAHVVVTIGSPNRAVVTGKVSSGGQPVAGVRIASDTSKYAFTDSNGDYAIAGLTAGSRTLTATLTGYTFSAAFTNPMTVTVNTTTPGADWTAGSVPTVTITATDANEGGANGSFVIARTGDTSAALDVLVEPASGLATKTADYTFSPDYVASGSLKKFTIPAGQATLTVVVAAVDDAAQEGPETVQLQASVGAYQVRGQGVAILTINDNDTTKPVVSIAATDPYATETPGDSGTFLISRTGATTAALNVTLAYSGSATRGSDYPSLATTFTIPAGQSSAPLSLVPIDDTLIETPETAIAAVSASGSYIVDATANAATVTITDNDLATVNVTAIRDTLREAGREPGVVLFTRTGSLAAPLKVYYGLSGSALHGTDYMELPGEVTIPAGMASAPVFITPIDDDIGEIDETITVQLTLFGSAYTLGPDYSATLTIKDNGDVPLITVGANTAAEPSTNGTFTFTANGSVTGNIIVRYTLSGTATPGSDYTAPSGSVTISGNGTKTATVSIPVINDAAPEDTETIVLTITPDPAYKVYNDGSATMRMTDDDSERIALSTHSAALAEPSSASSFYLGRIGSTGALAVNYTMSGTATNGVDYAMLGGVATIPDGATGVDVPVAPIDDTLAEGTETVTMTIAPGTGYGADVGTATLYLADNDSSAMASVGFESATGTTSETPDPTLGEYRDIPVTLSAAQPGTVTAEYSAGSGGSAFGDDVDWAIVDAAAGNAVIARGIVTFPPGTTLRYVRIRVKNDGVVEGNEIAVLELRNVNGARLSTSRNKHTLTITDAENPTPRVSFLVPATTRSEVDGSEPMLMAVLDRVLTTSVSVSYTVGGTATAGSDYSLAPGTLTFAPGETVKPLPLVILADTVTETAETIVVTLTNPTGAEIGANPSHTITLTEANVPILTIAATTLATIEGGADGAFMITRGNGLGLALTVAYTVSGSAVNGVDFTTLSGTVQLPAGQASVALPVSAIDDTTQEPDETVIVTLVASPDYALGTPATATVTIFDNDSPPELTLLSPEQDAVAIPSGVGLLCQVLAERATPSGPVQQPVTWSFVSGPATAAIESPGSSTTGVTFPADGHYIIRASSGSGSAIARKDLSVSVGVAFFPTRQIGTTTAAGSAVENTGTFTLTGAGSGISSTGTSDGFYFASAPVTGDFDVKCRVVNFTNPGGSGSCRFGIMARDGFAANALYAMTMFKSTGVHAYQYRTVAGATPGASAGTAVYTMPSWLRLTRTGNVFAAYYGTDGTTWTLRGTAQTIAMGPTCHLGLALTSAVSATTSTAVFDSLDFTPVTNNGPSVDAGPALTGSGPWTTDGSVADDGRPAGGSLTSLWSTHGGAGTANFVDATLADTAVTFPASGSYTLRLTATDTHTTTYDDTTANVTALSPVDAWRAAKFGADANNPAIAGNLADPDHDGLTNLMEYGFNLNPLAPDTAAQLPAPHLESGVLSIEYRRNLAATDVTFSVLGGAEMPVSLPIEVSEATLSDDGQTRVIRATPVTPSPGGQYFLRVSVSLTSP